MSDHYKSTELWKKSLGNISPEHAEKVELLRTVYAGFRDKAFALTSQIAKTLPGLTVHDGSHLDALWETADVIAGPQYPINPLEGFVLGGAILLHDAALSFEAYQGGREGLRETVEWRDSYAAIRERSPDLHMDEAGDEADFATLRLLHAKRAKELANAAWISPDGNQVFPINDEGGLRQRYGALIGQIAASHHWPIEEVANLSEQYNAPGNFPREWSVDPVKIACLLRCADAAHLDERRAPDFLLALARRQGISGHHWTAQNWLARVDVSHQAGEADKIVFTSNHDFTRANSDAWWVAYDAISLVQAEIASCNKLLSSRSMDKSPEFAIKTVKGASSPEELRRYVKASGWEPCSAKIHVGNVQKLVTALGGKQLYGGHDHIGVALRELLQNSQDAILARRIVEPGSNGRIDIELIQEEDGRLFLVISDNGVGMSERVLTGPLLDFGSSFWTSNLVQEEFPGLRSSAFKAVGRFGVGFYAIFMIAKTLTVSSRRWDAALDQIVTLDFPNGLTLRPTLYRGRSDRFPTTASTSIRLELLSDTISGEHIQINPQMMGFTSLSVTIPDYISTLICGIDVPVHFKGPRDKAFEQIHTPVSELLDKPSISNWINKTALVKYGISGVTNLEIADIVNRLRFVDSSDPRSGFAALSTISGPKTLYLSARTGGGFSTALHSRYDNAFVGFLDYPPQSAKRDLGELPIVPVELLRQWAEEQMRLLEERGMTELERALVTCHLCDLNVDPIDTARVAIVRDFYTYIVSLGDIFDIAMTSGLAILKAQYMDHMETHIERYEYKGFPVFRPVRLSSFLSLEGYNAEPLNPFSFLGCLCREASARGYVIDIETTSDRVKAFAVDAEVLIIRALPRDA